MADQVMSVSSNRLVGLRLVRSLVDATMIGLSGLDSQVHRTGMGSRQIRRRRDWHGTQGLARNSICAPTFHVP